MPETARAMISRIDERTKSLAHSIDEIKETLNDHIKESDKRFARKEEFLVLRRVMIGVLFSIVTAASAIVYEGLAN